MTNDKWQMTNCILPFSSQDAGLDRVGGKGANLAELTRAGFNVPPGYLITTEAYRAFVAANCFGDELLRLARAVVADDPVSLEQTAEKIRALFANASMPTEIAAEIQSAYALLSTDHSPLAVAVRSSATAEDLPGLSFAGQQETYLNIIGAEELCEAVKKCWGSLWTARAIGYRARNNIAPDDIALAVVVQQMIASEVSGVLFTANPLTGHRGEIVIDASFGLGEAIVSGQVEPDHFVVNATTWQITTRDLGEKSIAILPCAEGGTQTIEQSRADVQALPDEQIIALAKLSKRVADHYGAPQDIEWAWANRQLYLLQARPITSLYPLPALNYSPDDVCVYASFNSIQGIVGPITPLGRNFMQVVLSGLPVDLPASEYLPEAGARLFIDLTAFVRDPFARRIVLAVLARGDPAARQALLGVLKSETVKEQRTVTPLTIPRLLFKARHIIGRAVHALYSPEQACASAIKDAQEFVGRIRANVASADDLPSLLAILESDLPGAVVRVIARMVPVVAPGFGVMFALQKNLAEWLGLPSTAALQLARGLPNNPTTEMDLKLWATAQAIRADSAAATFMQTLPIEQLVALYQQRALPAVVQNVLEKFLGEYGMRGIGELDVGVRRWEEDPASIVQTINSYLSITDANLAPDMVFQRGAVEAERLSQEYVAQIRKTRFGAIRVRIFRAMYRRLRVLSGTREAPKFYAVTGIAAYRAAFLKQARTLVTQGKIEDVEDIFFVSLDDLKRFARGEPVDLKTLVAANRAEYVREQARRQLPRLLLSTGEVFYEGLSETGTSDLVGDGVSPGVVEGKVRVVLDPRGVRLEPGEILVCPATDPGWTPLFLAAGGLVMEVGGLVTHGAVVAREYGIPAIVGVHQATQRLQTGQRVQVDGSAGRVRILDSSFRAE